MLLFDRKDELFYVHILHRQILNTYVRARTTNRYSSVSIVVVNYITNRNPVKWSLAGVNYTEWKANPSHTRFDQ